MKNIITTFITAIVSLLFIAGCATQPEREVRLTEKFSGDSITLKKDVSFEVALSSNPTTGYSWKTPSFDKSILKIVSDKYVPASKKLVGSGGVRVFCVKAIKAGKTELKTVYCRPWEKKEKPTTTFELDVIVEQ